MSKHSKILMAFANALEDGMEKDAISTKLIADAIMHPNLTLRGLQLRGAIKRLSKSAKNIAKVYTTNRAGLGKVVQKHVPGMYKDVLKAKRSGVDLFNRLTGKGPLHRTFIEKEWEGAKRVGRGVKNLGIGVAAAGALGVGTLAYGALHRPPTSDFESLSRYE